MKMPKALGYVLAALAIVPVVVAGIDFGDRHNHVVDISRDARESLDPRSIAVLELLPGPLTVTALVPAGAEVERVIESFFDRYRRHKEDLSLRFVDPRRDPAAARELGAALGEVVISSALNSRSSRSCTMFICSSPKKPQRKPKPRA